AGLDDHDALAAAARLGAIDRHFRDQLVRAATDRERQSGRRAHALADALRGGRERLVMIDAFGAGQVEVPLVDTRAFDYRREFLEHLADLTAFFPALLEGDRDAGGFGAEAERASDRHRRADAILAHFVRGGADDAAAVARTADDQQRRLAGAFGINCTRDGDIKRVGIRQENSTHGDGLSEVSFPRSWK